MGEDREKMLCQKSQQHGETITICLDLFGRLVVFPGQSRIRSVLHTARAGINIHSSFIQLPCFDLFPFDAPLKCAVIDISLNVYLRFLNGYGRSLGIRELRLSIPYTRRTSSPHLINDSLGL